MKYSVVIRASFQVSTEIDCKEELKEELTHEQQVEVLQLANEHLEKASLKDPTVVVFGTKPMFQVSSISVDSQRKRWKGE